MTHWGVMILKLRILDVDRQGESNPEAMNVTKPIRICSEKGLYTLSFQQAALLMLPSDHIWPGARVRCHLTCHTIIVTQSTPRMFFLPSLAGCMHLLPVPEILFC